MKLWLKIFLSILLLSLTTLCISTGFMIHKSHVSNVNREQERSLNEFELIKMSFQNSIDMNTTSKETIKFIATRYGEYYAEKGIQLIFYYKDQMIYQGLKDWNQRKYNDFLLVKPGTKVMQILNVGNRNHIVLSGLLADSNEAILIYTRDITDIYHARNENIQLSIALAVLFILLLGFFSYLYAKWITKPVETLQKGALAISQGDYNIKLKKTNNEFGDVVKAFNDMAEAIENRTFELEQKAKERQVFIDDLSHEMNTPLTSIQGYAEFLLSANATEDQKQKAAKNIYTEAKRMKDIYTKLLTITLARERSIEVSNINMNDLLNEIKDSFFNLLMEKKIQLIFQIGKPVIQGDKTLIHMLLSNIIKNSIQAVDHNGLIGVEIYEEQKKVILSVTDNGIGIPKDKLEEVVKPFVRVDKSRSRKTGGAGLGLSICKDIITLHHGELIINSEIGKGTIVKVILPQ